MHRAAAILLLLATAAWGEPAREVRSRHYSITTDLPEDRARDVARHLDLAFEGYADRFSAFPVRDARPLRVWVFERQEDYLAHLASVELVGLGTGGMFFVTPDGAGLASFVASREFDDVLATLRHEGLHQFAYQRLGEGLPQWVNEGMAEYFGYALETRSGLVPGVVDPNALARLRAAIDNGAVFELSELLFITNERWNAMVTRADPRAALLYDQSWSVVHFLVHAEGGRYERLLLAYLRAAWQGKSVEQASTEIFGDDLERMARAWRDYVDQLRPDPLLEARDRLEVFAMALLPLHEGGRSPATLDELRTAVRERGFSGRVRTSTGVREVGPEDDWWLQAPRPPDAQGPVTFRLTPDRAGRTPPGVEVRGLRRVVRLRWDRSRDGTISHRVEID